jgi:hypothetical protein
VRPLVRAAPLLALAAACGPASDEPSIHISGPCETDVTWAPMPDQVQETSGLASSRAHPGVIWTHNDSQGDSALFAIDSAGSLIGRVRIAGATNRDWEDIAVAPCDPGSSTSCVFIGDIGDNTERRDEIVVYRVPEPDPRIDTVSVAADRLPGAYADHPRDAEALYVTRTGVHIVTKGRSGSIELFRLAPPYRPGRTTDLARVQQVAPPPTSVSAQVTAAAATSDGATVAIRTYSGLRFYEPDGDTLRPLGLTADFMGPAQPQGEGVDFLDPHRLVLTGEAGGRRPATLAIVRCDPRAPTSDPASADG